MKAYLEFLTDLYTISKNGGIEAFAPLISKHNVSRSTSAVLKELDWVYQDGKVFKWNGKKPTKKDAETLIVMLKDRNIKQKESKAKTTKTKAPVKTKKVSKAVEKTTNELKELGNAISNLNSFNVNEIKEIEELKKPDIVILEPTKTYVDKELNTDVENVLKDTISENSKILENEQLKSELYNLQIAFDMERTSNITELDRLNTLLEKSNENYAELVKINNLNVEELNNTKTHLDNQVNHSARIQSELDTVTEKFVALVKELEELKSRKLVKLSLWFRK